MGESDNGRGNFAIAWGSKIFRSAGYPALLLAFGAMLAVLVVVISREQTRNAFGPRHEAAQAQVMGTLDTLKDAARTRQHEHAGIAEALIRIATALDRLTASVERTATLQALTVQFLRCQAEMSVLDTEAEQKKFYRTSPLCQPMLRKNPAGED